jgi:fucose 4-O-acetylase-like acetyltransferase
LDGLRGLAIVMVVATHVLDYTQLPSDLKGTIASWVQTIAVPPFFLVDGFLFLRKLDRTQRFSYGNYIRQSAQRLVVPWVVFSILYAMFRLAFEYADPAAQFVIRGKGGAEIAAAMYYSAISAQMYFLLSLFLLRMASFLTYHLRTCERLLVVAIWCASIALWQAINIPAYFDHGLDPVLNACWGIQYYLLGIVLYRYVQFINSYSVVLTLFTGLLFVTGNALIPTFTMAQQYTYLLWCFFMFLSLAERDRLFTKIGRYSMEIYLLHAPIPLKATSLLVGRVIDATAVSYYVTVTVLTFLLACAAAILIRRMAWNDRFGAVERY